jgi:serine/threonine-protein kinase RsbW
MNTPENKAGMDGGPVRRQEWRVPARMECLTGLLAEVEAFLAAAGWSLAASHPVLLAIEELATNTIKYGYPAVAGTLEVVLAVTAATADLTLRDDGMPFDPVTAPPPDLDQPVEDRPIGGLGLHLVRRQSASFVYRRLATGHNEVHLIFHSLAATLKSGFQELH